MATELEKWLATQTDEVTKELAAAKEAKGFKEFKDGEYVGQLTTADMGISNAGRKQIQWGWTIVESDDPADLAEVYTDYQSMEKRKTHKDKEEEEKDRPFYYIGLRLKSHGYEIEDPADVAKNLPKALNYLVKSKTFIRFRLTTKKNTKQEDYQEFRILRHLPDYVPEITVPAAKVKAPAAPVSSPEDEAESVIENGDATVESSPGEIQVGMIVEFDRGDGTIIRASVAEIDEEAERVIVKSLKSGKLITVDPEITTFKFIAANELED